MALWSVNPSTSSSELQEGNEVMKCSKQDKEEEQMNLAEYVPVIQPIFTFSNLLLEPHVLATNESERVRSLAYNSNTHVSTGFKCIEIIYF